MFRKVLIANRGEIGCRIAATLHEIDIHSREVEGVFAAFRPDVVNHLAAQASVKLSTTDPVHDLEINGGGTARIAAECR